MPSIHIEQIADASETRLARAMASNEMGYRKNGMVPPHFATLPHTCPARMALFAIATLAY